MPDPFGNPQNFIVPTAPAGTNNDQAASTAFVAAAIGNIGGVVQASQFGFIADGVVNLVPNANTSIGSSYTTTVVSGTNNGPAWNTFLPWARNESANGRAVKINFAPGNYNYDLSTLVQPGFYGIKKLIVTGPGAIFTNTYLPAGFLDSPWLLQCAPYFTGASWPGDGVVPAGSGQPLGFLINTTNPGDKTITMVTAARTSYFSVGEWVLIGSYDIQMSGLPMNMYFVDYAQVEAIGVGTITLVTPLKYQHRSDNNDFSNSVGQPFSCGKARIWKLDTTGYGYAVPTPWDIDHTFDGIQVNLPPAFANTGFYTTMQGQYCRTRNWKGVGISPSTVQHAIHENDHYWTQPEIDKNIESIVFRSCVFDFASTAASSSVDRITYDDCSIGGIGVGAKQTVLNNCTVKNNNNLGSVFLLSAGQGCGGPVTFNNCSLQSYLGTELIPSVIDGCGPLPVSTDGSTPITYSNGTFIMNQATAAGLIPAFNAVPGQYVSLKPATGPVFAGDLGLGIVIGMRSDGTNVYMDTTIPFATLPSWAVSGVSATVYIVHNTQIYFNNCNGSGQARMVSEACAAGYDYWNRKTYVINGIFAGGGLAGWSGDLICADINVIHPSSGGGDVVAFSWPTYDAGTMAADSGGSSISINCGIAGRRVATQAMFVGKLGTDVIMVAGAASSFLPAGRLIADVAQFGKSFTAPTNYQSPLVEATFLFSTGQIRKVTTFNFTRTETGNELLATVGLLT